MTFEFLFQGEEIRRFWNKQAYLSSHKNSDISSFPSANDLISRFVGNIVSGNWIEPLDVNINASRIKEDGTHDQLMNVDVKTARNCYMNGFSLCFGDLSFNIDYLAELKSKASEIFGYPDLISVTGYLSPPKVTGVLHFDRQHNFFIQKEGVKRWFVSEKAAVKNPYANLVYPGLTIDFFSDMKARGYEIRLPRECGRNVYELNPGDILYIPPGFYHSPETLNEPSLHYTLTIEPACFWKDLNNHMYSSLLASDGKFYEDYRFLSELEKTDLIKHCFNFLLNRPK